jgi:hypothetical protein
MENASSRCHAGRLGRDWATLTGGTKVNLGYGWVGLASFTAQFGQTGVATYGGLFGLNFAFDWERRVAATY